MSPPDPTLRRRLPVHLVVAGALLTLALTGGMVWMVDDTETAHAELAADNVELTRLSGQLLFLDEVLTSSALLAAFDGAPRHRQHHRDAEPLLTQALSETLRLTPDDATTRAVREVMFSNKNLVDLELRAFDLIDIGRPERAQALLTGEAYDEAKRVYSAALAGVRDATDMRTMNTLTTLHRELREWILYGTASLAVLVSMWMVLIGLVHRALDRRDASEAALVDARALAERQAEGKAQFLATMSHEIRTPMNGVLGMAHLLGETRLSADQRETLGIIQSSGESLLTLIDDILDVSKMEAGQLEVEQIPFDLRAGIRDVCTLMGLRARDQGISLSHHVDERLPSRVVGDPTRIRQVLTNLLNNAIKFTSDGGVELRCVADASQAGGVDVLLQVLDTGIGIPADRMHRLFQDYSQVESSTTREFGGTGLGLAICKRLTDLMGGEITAESEPGKGSIFSVMLPLGLPADAAPLPRRAVPSNTAALA